MMTAQVLPWEPVEQLGKLWNSWALLPSVQIAHELCISAHDLCRAALLWRAWWSGRRRFNGFRRIMVYRTVSRYSCTRISEGLRRGVPANAPAEKW